MTSDFRHGTRGLMRSASVAHPRANFLLRSAFAGSALILALVGVSGLLAFTVVRRTTELGIRLALGGRPRDIERLIVWQGARLIAAGIASGLPAALVTARAIRTLLFGIEPADAVSLVASIVMLSVVSLVACDLPTRRATPADPLVALRTE